MSPIRPENKGRYPKNWREISNRIKGRAGWRCECGGECGHDHQGRCNRRHDQALRLRYDRWGFSRWSRVVLTVAHLDHTPENCEDGNLKAMCQRCHLSYDAPRKRADRLARMNEGQGVLL